MTYLQGMAYELARELIASQIGRLSSQIGLEEQVAVPDEQRITELEAQIIAFAKEREDLEPEDDRAVRMVIARYSRSGTIPQDLYG